MSLKLKLLNTILRASAKPMLRRIKNPRQIRLYFNLATRLLFKPSGVRFIQNGKSTEVTCSTPDPNRVVLYLHGGGYIAGSAYTHRGLLGRLSKKTGLRIVVPEYRLAPEHPLPAALEDALAAWDALLVKGICPQDIILAGDSAGGGLAFALLAQLCGRATPPQAVVAFSPWTDLTGQSPSITDNAKTDPIFPAERFEDLVGFTLGVVPPKDPRISPVFANFPNAPPSLIQVGETEIIRDDSLRMAKHLRSFGAKVRVETWAHTPHVWHMFGILSETQEALENTARFLKEI